MFTEVKHICVTVPAVLVDGGGRGLREPAAGGAKSVLATRALTVWTNLSCDHDLPLNTFANQLSSDS